jgi:cytochrome c-type biogenesis protein CcmE
MFKTIVIATVGLAFALAPATALVMFGARSSERLVLVPVDNVRGCQNPERLVQVGG